MKLLLFGGRRQYDLMINSGQCLVGHTIGFAQLVCRTVALSLRIQVPIIVLREV